MSSKSKQALKSAGDAPLAVAIGGGLCVGDGAFTVIAGPCALESAEQIEQTAAAVKAAGAHLLRGGAFKPRTSPYSFQGLGQVGLQLLAEQGRRHRLPVVSEIMDASQLSMMLECVDVLQIGARNMQNFSLLREVAKARRPVLLKRGFGATLEEWLQSAEYLLAGGNEQVILCERGIRSFDNTLRNTLDLAGVAWIKQHSKLPVIVDPSHATGISSLVAPMCLAAAAAGADGLMVEVHPTPDAALCDGPQALSPEMFTQLMQTLRALLHALGRDLALSGVEGSPRAESKGPATALS